MKKAGVNMAKNKVKVEYDVDMEKERRKKQQKNGKPGFAIRRSNILLYGLLLVVEVLFYYFLTPAINVHTSGFWTWVILTLAAIGFCSFDFKGTRITKKGNIKEAVGSTKVVIYNNPCVDCRIDHWWAGIFQIVACIEICRNHQG
jgi:hypothetical protein